MDDIRDVEKDTNRQDARLASWPYAKPNPLRDASGIECLLVLVRLFNCQLPHSSPRRAAQTGRGEPRQYSSTLERLSWARIKDTKTLSADISRLIRELGAANLKEATFERLFCSEPMNSEVWSRPEHRLFDTFIKKTASSPWGVDTDPYVDIFRIGRDAVTRPLDIGKEVISWCDNIITREDGAKLRRFPPPPLYFRIEYTPFEGAGVQDLSDLQVWSFRDPRLEANQPDDGVDHASIRYVLTAAVRMRSEPNERDHLRLFTVDGSDIYTGMTPPDGDPCWSIGLPGHKYLLIYTISNWPICELTPQEREDLILDRRDTNDEAARLWESGRRHLASLMASGHFE
ncbi:hypothetical protein CkaCkLH20_12357 [Colletotrichum karsti]|uniref:Uncharacterized protein n=1 Tax=Colletotrichum karsti TaxID=1095194 RepID=A0A9P6HT77_9PEZI|nr:uncharacterized protein CkaCkLH20_12357 [Colletotrichum karsti]KAF9870123.1 hypothetical protein CkaCkLH20_12357 [Colletotrichum karsti]